MMMDADTVEDLQANRRFLTLQFITMQPSIFIGELDSDNIIGILLQLGIAARQL